MSFRTDSPFILLLLLDSSAFVLVDGHLHSNDNWIDDAAEGGDKDVVLVLVLG